MIVKNLHPRNLHHGSYDFEALIQHCPTLADWVFTNQYGKQTINFAEPQAVKSLNKALLAMYYGIRFWDIPPQYLCPPIPGRADYIHHIADLLSLNTGQKPPTGDKIKVLDIGVGANCVYPIIGHQVYGWRFVASDIDAISLRSAQAIITHNPSLSKAVTCRLQTSAQHYFKNIIQPNEFFDVSICNPPFHSSAAAANEGSLRKQRNLTGKLVEKPVLNFGGKSNELWCEGGEARFIAQMIRESRSYATQCLWFTSLVSKKENLFSLEKQLQKVQAQNVVTMPMAQGQKVSRILAWTFLTPEQQTDWIAVNRAK